MRLDQRGVGADEVRALTESLVGHRTVSDSTPCPMGESPEGRGQEQRQSDFHLERVVLATVWGKPGVRDGPG